MRIFCPLSHAHKQKDNIIVSDSPEISYGIPLKYKRYKSYVVNPIAESRVLKLW